MISHGRAQELISARMDAPLAPAEHRELQGHLATCDSCRFFVAHADDLARGLQVLPRLAPSPAVSRAVMAAVSTDNGGWGWLRRGLQTLSSPGMAVASGLALVLALAGALLIALNAPGGGDLGTEPEGTIAAVAVAPLPTEAPAESFTPEPTATRAPQRTVIPARAVQPAKTPTPRPTATRVSPVKIAAPAEEPAIDPATEPAAAEQPPIEPVAEEPVLAMTEEQAVDPAVSADLAQNVAEPQPSDAGGGEAAADDGGRRNEGGRKDGGQNGKDDAAAASEPVAAEPVQVPDGAISALETAGATAGDYLPPAPLLPMPPPQAFLPITPTPVTDGTPTPESETQSDAPQLAEDSSGELGVAALAPEPASETIVEGEKVRNREKREKSADGGESIEQKQVAYVEEPMAWSSEPIELLQTVEEPIYPEATTEEPVETVATTDEFEDTATIAESEPQYDPATGLEIDAATGLLIDPTTGYLLDLVNGRIIHPGTGYLVHPMTGLLIDPATGAQLDPVTLAIVIPAGFGSDQPLYVPGSDAMREQIEASVDETYDNATYKVIPATDGPAQPIGEIVVPVETGEAREIS